MSSQQLTLLPDIPVAVLDGSDSVRSLREFCSGKAGVIDLWHTKCIKCPAALERFNIEAANFSNTNALFIACALSLGEGNKEDVADIGPDSWNNLHHVFVEIAHKDTVKAAFGYSAVPYYVLFDRTGFIVKCGDSKSFDYVSELTKLLATDESAGSETNNENTPLETNAVALSHADKSSAVAAKSIGSDEAVRVEPSIHVFALDEDF